MAAALAQLRRTACKILCALEYCAVRLSESLCHAVGSKFACAWKVACESALQRIACAEQASYVEFNNRLTVFNHDYLAAFLCQSLNLSLWQRILRYFQDVGSLAVECFLNVVVGNSAGNDAQFAVAVFNLVVYRIFGCAVHLALLLDECVVFLSCNSRKENPTVLRRVQFVLLASLANLNGCARVCQSGYNAQKHRLFDSLGVVERLSHHVVGFLLVRRFENRNHGKFSVEARVLLVLRRVHRWVVGSKYNQAAVYACYG